MISMLTTPLGYQEHLFRKTRPRLAVRLCTIGSTISTETKIAAATAKSCASTGFVAREPRSTMPIETNSTGRRSCSFASAALAYANSTMRFIAPAEPIVRATRTPFTISAKPIVIFRSTRPILCELRTAWCRRRSSTRAAQTVSCSTICSSISAKAGLGTAVSEW